jgi:hypothetical protein
MFAHAFVRNAYLAGTVIALACGTTGWFVVLRAQVFAADALSHVAFVGAIGAVVIGIDARVGLFVLTLGLAGVLSGLGRRGQVDDVPIGIMFAWVLGIGVLLIEILARSSHGTSGITTVNTLFGSIYSLSAGASALAAIIGLLAVLGVLALFRPLLGAPAHDPAAPWHRAVRSLRGPRHVGRTRARLRDPVAPAEHGDHRRRGRDVRALGGPGASTRLSTDGRRGQAPDDAPARRPYRQGRAVRDRSPSEGESMPSLVPIGLRYVTRGAVILAFVLVAMMTVTTTGARATTNAWQNASSSVGLTNCFGGSLSTATPAPAGSGRRSSCSFPLEWRSPYPMLNRSIASRRR